MNNTYTIHASGLVKKFGDFTAVNGIDFDVKPGEIFGLLGPNGSGKTTSIRMLLGLLEPTEGAADILGYSVDTQSAKIRPLVGYMSQKFSLYNDLTVQQNLNFYGSAYGLENDHLQQRISDVLETANLSGRQNIKTKDLSGGWRQRLALCASILHQPEVMFLDEPTAGVDPISRRAFWDLLYLLASEGVTVFVTTHYMDEAEHCHRLAFIQRGSIIAQGSPIQIKQNVMKGRVLELSLSEPVRSLKILKDNQEKIGLDTIELYGSLVHIIDIDISKKQNKIKKILTNCGIKVNTIEIIDPSLEDVFISCMQVSQ